MTDTRKALHVLLQTVKQLRAEAEFMAAKVERLESELQFRFNTQAEAVRLARMEIDGDGEDDENIMSDM